MPQRLPMRDFAAGLAHNVWRALRCWLIYTLVATAWLGVVPLTACRIYRAIFTGSIASLLTLPFDLFSL
jgi:E3 ubiquitin-protein ligase MARCH6